MDEREEVETLIDAVRTGVGLDVYVFDEDHDTKHLLPDALIVAIITALVVEFFKGLLHPKETGEAANDMLRWIASRMRREAEPDLTELESSLRRYIQEAKALPRQARMGHVPAFVTKLVDAGVPVETAVAIADAVGKEVARLGP